MRGLETWRRAIVKSVIWRVLGVLILGVISYAFTGSWTESIAITGVFTLIRVVLFVVHERIWDRIAWGRNPCPRCGYTGPWLVHRHTPLPERPSFDDAFGIEPGPRDALENRGAR